MFFDEDMSDENTQAAGSDTGAMPQTDEGTHTDEGSEEGGEHHDGEAV